MKLIKKSLLLTAAIMMAWTLNLEAQELTFNDVVTEFNAGAEALNNQNFEEAISHFDKTIEMADQVGEEAAELKTQAMDQIPDLYFKIGYDLYKEKDYEGSIGWLVKADSSAIKYGDDDIREKSEQVLKGAYFAQGNSMYKINAFDFALENYDKVLEMDPDNTRAHYMKTLIYRKTGEEDKMLEEAEKTIKSGEASGDTETAGKARKIIVGSMMKEAQSEYSMEDLTSALETLDEILAVDETTPEAHYLKALIFNKQLEFEKAVQAAEKAVEHAEGTPEELARFYFTLAKAYQGNVAYDKACEAYAKSLYGNYEERARYEMDNVLNCDQ